MSATAATCPVRAWLEAQGYTWYPGLKEEDGNAFVPVAALYDAYPGRGTTTTKNMFSRMLTRAGIEDGLDKERVNRIRYLRRIRAGESPGLRPASEHAIVSEAPRVTEPLRGLADAAVEAPASDAGDEEAPRVAGRKRGRGGRSAKAAAPAAKRRRRAPAPASDAEGDDDDEDSDYTPGGDSDDGGDDSDDGGDGGGDDGDYSDDGGDDGGDDDDDDDGDAALHAAAAGIGGEAPAVMGDAAGERAAPPTDLASAPRQAFDTGDLFTERVVAPLRAAIAAAIAAVDGQREAPADAFLPGLVAATEKLHNALYVARMYAISRGLAAEYFNLYDMEGGSPPAAATIAATRDVIASAEAMLEAYARPVNVRDWRVVTDKRFAGYLASVVAAAPAPAPAPAPAVVEAAPAPAPAVVEAAPAPAPAVVEAAPAPAPADNAGDVGAAALAPRRLWQMMLQLQRANTPAKSGVWATTTAQFAVGRSAETDAVVSVRYDLHSTRAAVIITVDGLRDGALIQVGLVSGRGDGSGARAYWLDPPAGSSPREAAASRVFADAQAMAQAEVLRLEMGCTCGAADPRVAMWVAPPYVPACSCVGGLLAAATRHAGVLGAGASCPLTRKPGGLAREWVSWPKPMQWLPPRLVKRLAESTEAPELKQQRAVTATLERASALRRAVERHVRVAVVKKLSTRACPARAKARIGDGAAVAALFGARRGAPCVPVHPTALIDATRTTLCCAYCGERMQADPAGADMGTILGVLAARRSTKRAPARR